jgi:membrane fusion protein (multidrug efflux system)
VRSLDADGFRFPAAGLLLIAVILGSWMAWFCFSRVALYEVTGTARLEVDQAAHPVASQVFGRVVTTHLELGREVQRGDVLVELDTNEQRLQIIEEQTRVSAISHQLAALRGELAAEQQAAAETHQSAPVALDEARARYEEAAAAARAGAEEARRLAQLRTEGIVSDMEAIRSQAEAQKRQAAADALRIAINRQDKDQHVRESDRQVRQENLKREMAALEGEIMTKTATIERLRQTVEQRRILAPAAGRLGEVADLRIGAVVRDGDKLGAIVPPGQLRVVAEYPPSAVLGRIRAGQPARLRLEGFPWTEYGKVAATVARVGSEPRSGQVRVELAIDPNSSSHIPLQHGLPGAIEVEVERVSPAALALRAVGKMLAREYRER